MTRLDCSPLRTVRQLTLLLIVAATSASSVQAADYAGKPVFSQINTPVNTSEVGWSMTAWTWPIKLAFVSAVTLAAFVLGFFAIYGSLLRSGWWPLEAYGATTCFVLLIAAGAGLFAFWQEMVIRRGNAPVEWYDKVLFRTIFIIVTLLVCWIVYAQFRRRSEHRRLEAT